MVVLVALEKGPFISWGVPALPSQITATSVTSCFQLEDTVGETGQKLLYITKKFPAGFHATEGQGMGALCLHRCVEAGRQQQMP